MGQVKAKMITRLGEYFDFSSVDCSKFEANKNVAVLEAKTIVPTNESDSSISQKLHEMETEEGNSDYWDSVYTNSASRELHLSLFETLDLVKAFYSDEEPVTLSEHAPSLCSDENIFDSWGLMSESMPSIDYNAMRVVQWAFLLELFTIAQAKPHIRNY
ncbi:MAG: hypothetical protein IPN76_14170 [Saprospiraceae bacterium]|nr:hypothetical protein [Saprospiraceae bacterium]